jgi:uncharacterized protein (TIGR00369 family)
MNEEKEDLLKLLRHDLSKVPFHRFLGLNLDCFDFKNGCIRFDIRDEFVGNMYFDILHGGVIASILDIEGAFILSLNGVWHPKISSTATPQKLKGGTINLHIDYLRPGRGKHFVVTGTILRHGNKVAVVSSQLRNEQDELIAVGTGTYLIG